MRHRARARVRARLARGPARRGEAIAMSEWAEREAALRARLDEPMPESWVPQPGEEIVGVFRRLEKGTTAYGEAWICVLESTRALGRLASVWLLHTSLRNELARLRPQPGELV